MASEAITRNDLKAILNEVLPPTPSEFKKLLWTNPSTSYSTGTISLDLSEYDEVELLFYADDSFATAFYSRTKVGKNGTASWWNVRTDLSNLNNINSVTRDYTVSTTGVTFQNGNMIYNGTSYAGWSGRCVPYQIYGIKYERVAPPQIELPTYSTIEQVVGTWIDGKPIYRKVYIPFETKSYASGSYTVTLDVPIGKIIRWDVLTTGNNNENQEVNKYIVPGRYTKTSNQISLDCTTSSYSTNITHIILEYTKSTD